MSTKCKQPPYKQYYCLQAKGLYVYYDGKTVMREYPNKYSLLGKKTRYLKIKTDKDGNKYVNTKDAGDIRVDLMVASCYCHREPGQKYIIHLDNNNANCHRYNLRWATAEEYRKHYGSQLSYTDKATGKKWEWAEDNVYVTDKGDVRIDGKDQTIVNLVSDPDLGCCRCVFPYVRACYGSESYRVEELVAGVFCPKPKGLSNEAILHIDYDFTNNEASNLRWVERTDREYVKYDEQRKKDWATINLQNGPLP